MSNPDLRTAGELALLEVRALKVMLRLSAREHRKPGTVLEATSPLRDKQPALAASLLVQEALKHPPHRWLAWLESAKDMIQEYALGPDADREAAQRAHEHLDILIERSKTATATREKWIDRISKVLFTIFVLTALAAMTLWIVERLSAPADDSAGKPQAASVKVNETKTK